MMILALWLADKAMTFEEAEVIYDGRQPAPDSSEAKSSLNTFRRDMKAIYGLDKGLEHEEDNPFEKPMRMSKYRLFLKIKNDYYEDVLETAEALKGYKLLIFDPQRDRVSWPHGFFEQAGLHAAKPDGSILINPDMKKVLDLFDEMTRGEIETFRLGRDKDFIQPRIFEEGLAVICRQHNTYYRCIPGISESEFADCFRHFVRNDHPWFERRHWEAFDEGASMADDLDLMR